MSQQTRFESFRELHRAAAPLILPNAWDVGTAVLIARAGAPAIATTSSGVANALGYADGNHVPPALVADLARRIVAAVDVPVTTDIESGYGEHDEARWQFVDALIDAGVVGINIEDGGREPAAYAETVRHLAGQMERNRRRLFINARIDAYLRRETAPLEQAKERMKVYTEAGADGLFVPGAPLDDLRALCAAATLPVNAMFFAGGPSLEDLAGAGVSRISVGGTMAHVVQGVVNRMTRRILALEPCDELYREAMSYGDANALFASER